MAGITAALIDAIARGRLLEDDPLPSTRLLASQIGCSRTMTVRVYDELVAAGYVIAVPGSGTRVAAGASRAARARLAVRVPEQPTTRGTRPSAAVDDDSFALRAGLPDASLIDPSDWRRAWRFAAQQPVADGMTWEQPNRDLTAAITNHMRLHRGIATDHVQFASGASMAITALAASIGLATVIEDPGYRRAYEAFVLAGLAPKPCPVDDQGIVVDQLPDASHLVYLTPAHQFPMGVRMSLPRRQQIVTWAHDTGSVLIEDDYDGEFRYGVAPLPALRSLPGAEDVVAYIGTASKMLTPSLQAAWIVAPSSIAPALKEQLSLRRTGVSAMTALALAHFIDTGALNRHIARACRTYSARRIALIRALHRHLPEHRIGGVGAGLHLRIDLPEDATIAMRLAALGYQVEPLSSSNLIATASGLIIGYAQLPETRAEQVAIALRAALDT